MVAADQLPAPIRALYPFQGSTFDLGGYTLHYLDEGPEEPEETFLMVHGNPTWSFYYRTLVTALSEKHRCIVPDHIGCGLSDKPQDYPYTLAQHVDNLTRLIEHLDLHNVTLVVHDWGGLIGYGAALNVSDRIKRLVFFNTTLFTGDIPLSIRMCRWPLVGDLVIRGFNGFARVGLLRAIGDRNRMKNGVSDGYLLPYDDWKNRIAHVNFVRDIPLEQHHPTRPTFEGIEARATELADRPTLVIWGEKDFCFNMDYYRGFEQRFPNAEFHTFPDASHWVVEDAHERIVPLLTDFIARNQIS